MITLGLKQGTSNLVVGSHDKRRKEKKKERAVTMPQRGPGTMPPQ